MWLEHSKSDRSSNQLGSKLYIIITHTHTQSNDPHILYNKLQESGISLYVISEDYCSNDLPVTFNPAGLVTDRFRQSMGLLGHAFSLVTVRTSNVLLIIDWDLLKHNNMPKMASSLFYLYPISDELTTAVRCCHVEVTRMFCMDSKETMIVLDMLCGVTRRWLDACR